MNKNFAFVVAATVVALAAFFTVTIPLFPNLFFTPDYSEPFRERYFIGHLSISKETLLLAYNLFSHAIFFIVLIAVALYLLHRLLKSASRPFLQLDHTTIAKAAYMLKRNPESSTLFVIYSVFMFYGTSWYYPELLGWYSAIYTGDLLQNFQLNDALIKETMRRNDFRFFPLAHQDLQVLSWLTPYAKVWIIVNALELLLILVFATKFIQYFAGKNTPHVFLFSLLLLLSLPSTVKAFFQFIYSERMLVLFLSMYLYSYLRYQQTKQDKYLYAVLLTAMLGIFFKDIAFILFGTPPFVTMVLGSCGRYDNYQPLTEKNWGVWMCEYRLELMLICLVAMYFVFYAFLSLLPSIVKAEGAYNDNFKRLVFQGLSYDVRLWILMSTLAVRATLIVRKQVYANVLDTINLSAVLYLFALAYLVGFKTSSYMALPIHFVALLNIVYAWVLLYEWSTKKGVHRMVVVMSALVLVVFFLMYEQFRPNNFLSVARSVKDVQRSWLATFSKAEDLARNRSANGKEVNVIYTISWFKYNRQLNRIKYDRLVFLDPDDMSYTIIDGVDKGKDYRPRAGDFLLMIDDRSFRLPKTALANFEIVYQFDERLQNGKIYEYQL